MTQETKIQMINKVVDILDNSNNANINSLVNFINELYSKCPTKGYIKTYYTSIKEVEVDRELSYQYIERARNTMIEACKQVGGSYVFEKFDTEYSLLEHISYFQFVSMEYIDNELIFTVHSMDDNENIEITFEELNNDQIIIIDILDYIFKNTIIK